MAASLLTRVSRLEERAGGTGDCPVCLGEPPWAVKWANGEPKGEPCSGCGQVRLIHVVYDRPPSLPRHGSA